MQKGGAGLWLLAALWALEACEKAPEGGWGPASEVYSADGLGEADLQQLRVPADGRVLRVTLADGEEVAVQLPDAAGRGLLLGGTGLNGVGAYPGARFDEVLVRVLQPGRTDGARLILEMEFRAGARAEVVADWYQAQFRTRMKPGGLKPGELMVQREGLVLNGGGEASSWTLVLRDEDGGCRGEIRLRRG